jgi:hypothetical protein
MNVVCKKVSYSSEEFADSDIKLFNMENRRLKPTRSYLCLKCNTWHLTSSPISSLVVKRYYKEIVSLKNMVNLLTKNVNTLKADVTRISNSKSAVKLLKLQEECKKLKRDNIFYRNRFQEKCNEFSAFKNQVNKLIEQIEGTNKL